MSEQAQNNNINDILDNIKEVITTGKAPTNEEDVLVLTEKVESNKPVENGAPSTPAQPQMPQAEELDDMSALMEAMSKQPTPPDSQQVSQAQNPQQSSSPEADAKVWESDSKKGSADASGNDGMMELMKKIANDAAASSGNVQANSSQSSGKDILDKIDEDSDWGEALNEQKNLTSQDFSAPAFNQLKDEEKTDSLLSEQVAVKSMEKLKTLVEQLEPKPSKLNTPHFRAGITLEDLVMEAMKPEISQWLNNNLPQLVTNIVEKEIKKIIPR